MTEGNIVKTLVEKEGYPAGSRGVIVSKYKGGPLFEVEIWDNNDYPVDVIAYYDNELEKIG